MKFTRAQRREFKRRAAFFARFAAETSAHIDQSGKLALERDPRARATLERGFRALFENMCRPVVQELTPEEGARLRNPNRLPPPPFSGVRHWAGFGIDIDGRATFVTNWTLMHGLPEAEVAAEAERFILERLAATCNVRGLPAEAAP